VARRGSVTFKDKTNTIPPIRQRKRMNRSRDREQIADDISWINEKNRKFNQKISRFYDKYTKEIRENLERGTAL
jgi:pre-mRNA-splicing factor SYF2